MKNTIFYRQADLLLDLLPIIHEQGDFALHGGTALNFFVQDLPRLSVDIDLTYLPIESRGETLKNISKRLRELAKKIRGAYPSIEVKEKEDDAGRALKLMVKRGEALVKLEPNLVIRGSVFGTEDRALVPGAGEIFEKFVRMRTLPVYALYGSKICAALDRQHPRDLFDVKLMFANKYFTPEVKEAFLVYLLSSNRPMHELLNPSFKDVQDTFKKEFLGMTAIKVTYFELEEARRELVHKIHLALSDADRQFLISFKDGKPDWNLFALEGVESLPAVKWKLKNILQMDPDKHKQARDALKKVLAVSAD